MRKHFGIDMTKTQTKIYAVRKEYEEPFKDVIIGYAKLGYSKGLVCRVLGFHSQLFWKLLSHFDLHSHFDRKNYNDSCTPKGKGWPKGVPRKKGGKRIRVVTKHSLPNVVAVVSGCSTGPN
jgi:hypothetical protein